jgi:hypothetical protein
MDGYQDLVPQKTSASDSYADLVPRDKTPKKQYPVMGSEIAAQIPTGGYPTVKPTEMAGEPKFLEKASMYATAVPAGGLASGLLKTATAGTKAAPYTARLAEALTPKTLPGLLRTTGAAAAASVPAEAARYQAEKRGASPVQQELVELGVGGVFSALEGLAYKAGTTATDLVRRAFGSSKEFSNALREKTSGLTEQFLNRTKEQQQLVDKVLEQMSRKPDVAAGRVQAKTAGPLAEERLGVREKLGAQISKAETTERTAKRRLDMAQSDLQKSQAAVDQLETRLSGRPGITADELGGVLQPTTKKLADDAIAARKDAAGYENVFKTAGDTPTVDTSGSIANIDKILKETRNPTLQNILKEIKSQATTGAKIDEATGEFLGGSKKLTLRSADSLKGYLDSIIQSKMHKSTPNKLDKEILNVVRDVKKSLVNEAKTAHKEYGEAINKFREMSRPLDIVERNGALRKVIDEDPVSTAYKMTEAEVAGHVIRKANAGNPVFTRLLQVNPELKEPARLYFTKELFGKDAAPTAKSFETWLRDNERSLNQLGLYNEFNTLRNAQKTAQQSVDVAKGIVASAEERVATATAKKESAESLAKKASSRLAEALKTAETPEQLAKRVQQAQKPVPQQATFESKRAAQQNLIDTLDDAVANLGRATKPAEVEASVRSTAKTLRSKNLITAEQFDAINREADMLSKSIDSQADAQKILKRVAGAVLGTGLVGYGAGRIFKE